MYRSIIVASLASLVAFTPFVSAKNSDGTRDNGNIHGHIQSLSNTLFSVGVDRPIRGSQAIVVHYNPETAIVTVDGQRVQFLDIADIGKYATVSGEMVDNQLEARVISVTSGSGPKKSKGK
jgi:hypothetical protein